MTNLFFKQSPWSCAAAAGAFALLFAACGDEVTEVTQVVGMQVVEAGDALPKCSADNEGAMVYSVDSAAAYTCISRKWTSMKGKDGKDGADGKDGKDGKNGTNGEDGAKGAPGVKGDSGATGNNGLSAYEIAKAGGYTGTEEEWITSLKGAPGVKGDSGATGNNGLSAYEIAKAGGYTGTEEEWIASLKGDPGAKGDSGATGNNGLSAYEIAKAGGYTGTEEEWIASLKGDPGANGSSCSAKEVAGGVEITCTDGKSFTLSNGANGTSCSAKEVAGGVKITCTDGKSFTLSNGADGKDGKSFVDGWMVDPRDKQLYRVVTIGEQTWMAENLNYKTENSWCGGGSGSNEGDCSKYGRLYLWSAAVGKSEDDCGAGKTCGLSGRVRGVCPEGWHLPDTTEWKTLFAAVGGKSTAGKKLRSQTGWNDYNGTSGNGTDAYGFSAFPAGSREDYNGSFNHGGYGALFWSATQNNGNLAYYIFLYYNDESAYLFGSKQNGAFSVRCVKD